MKVKAKFRWISLALGIALIAVSLTFPQGCTVTGVRTVEHANYRVLHDYGPIKLRQYDELLTIETSIDAGFGKAGQIAVDRLFGYISGDNVAKTKIAITARVIVDTRTCDDIERLDMTMPVLEKSKPWAGDIVSFFLRAIPSKMRLLH